MSENVVQHVAEIASAYVSHNHIRAEEVSGLICAIHAALGGLEKSAEPFSSKPKPAVDLPWKKTIRPEYLISLLDGKHYKTLRRHLSKRGLTPEAYRERYDLPKDYPMVAAGYSEKRSALAREIGLGRKSEGEAAVAAVKAEEAASVAEPLAAAPDKEQANAETAPRKRGRPARKKAAEAA